MNEILFRGKRMDTGCSWVYGCYVYDEDGDHYIIEVEGSSFISPKIKVIPETVGQYIGLKDENGKKEFKGDIVKFDKRLGTQIGQIVFDHGCFKHSEDFGYEGEDLIDLERCQIIGNIFDHPELIKEFFKTEYV